METMARKTYNALTSAGAPADKAEAAASDLGDLAGEARILRWMIGTLIGITVAGFVGIGAALLQIALRL